MGKSGETPTYTIMKEATYIVKPVSQTLAIPNWVLHLIAGSWLRGLTLSVAPFIIIS